MNQGKLKRTVEQKQSSGLYLFITGSSICNTGFMLLCDKVRKSRRDYCLSRAIVDVNIIRSRAIVCIRLFR